MSGHPQGAQYDDGYAHQQGQDSYYQDDQYAQYHDDQHQRGAPGYQDHQAGDAYYDESYALIAIQASDATADNLAVPITMVSRAMPRPRARASINKMAIMTIADSRDTSKTSITTINIMTKAVLRPGMIKMGMGMFQP